VAHVLLERLDLGDVHLDAGEAAAAHRPVDGLDPAPVPEADDERTLELAPVFRLAREIGLAVSVLVTDGDVAALDIDAAEFGEVHAGPRLFLGIAVEVAKIFVADHQPAVGVVDDDGLDDAAEGVEQRLLRAQGIQLAHQRIALGLECAHVFDEFFLARGRRAVAAVRRGFTPRNAVPSRRAIRISLVLIHDCPRCSAVPVDRVRPTLSRRSPPTRLTSVQRVPSRPSFTGASSTLLTFDASSRNRYGLLRSCTPRSSRPL